MQGELGSMVLLGIQEESIQFGVSIQNGSHHSHHIGPPTFICTFFCFLLICFYVVCNYIYVYLCIEAQISLNCLFYLARECLSLILEFPFFVSLEAHLALGLYCVCLLGLQIACGWYDHQLLTWVMGI